MLSCRRDNYLVVGGRMGLPDVQMQFYGGGRALALSPSCPSPISHQLNNILEP